MRERVHLCSLLSFLCVSLLSSYSLRCLSLSLNASRLTSLVLYFRFGLRGCVVVLLLSARCRRRSTAIPVFLHKFENRLISLCGCYTKKKEVHCLLSRSFSSLCPLSFSPRTFPLSSSKVCVFFCISVSHFSRDYTRSSLLLCRRDPPR